MSEGLKQPPISIEAEQQVLGSIMQWPECFDEVAGLLRAEDFYRRDHRLIYEAILALDGEQIDTFMVHDYLERRHQDVGGLAYLGSLTSGAVSKHNVIAYGQLIANRALERRVITAANQILDLCYNGAAPTESKTAQAEQILSAALDSQVRDTEPKPIKHYLTGAVDEIDKAFQAGDVIRGLSTGLPDLDEKISGLNPGDLIIIAGRPSMGKSTLAFNIADHVANVSQKVTLGFTLEMNGKKIALRQISALGNVGHWALRNGKLGDEDWPRITYAVGQLAESKLYIDDSPCLSITQLRAKARRLARKQGLGLIVVDYLQLLEMPGDNRNNAIGEATRGLKRLAGELQVPVIVLSQLNRGLEDRPNKRPRMSDLRESGAIEQDADVVLFIYRDEVYNEDGPYQGLAELIIAKQRDGALGTVRVGFRPDLCRFETHFGDWPQPEKPTSRKGGLRYGNAHADERAA